MGDLDNDMDELFRKAANQYPLKTDGADWDKVIGKLPDAVGTPLPIIDQKAGKTNKKLLWLILLFPMGWLCNSYYTKEIEGDKKMVLTQSNLYNKKVTDSLQVVHNKLNTNNVGINKLSDNNIVQTQSKKNTDEIKTQNQSTKNSNINYKATNTTDKPKEIYKEQTSITFNSGKSLELRNASEKEITQKNSGDDVTENLNSTQPVIKTQPGINAIKQVTDTAVQAMANNKKDSIQRQNADTAKNVAKKTDKKIERNKGFYVSAIGGFDASSVKSQGVKKVGYGFGLLIGYQLSKHIAFETGLLWDKKKYYTDGEYFNKTRTGIPNNYYVSDINGNCNMFEVPIDFRYNFAQNKKGMFFATAGLSSYFMKKEAYNYEATAWGSTWPAMKTYNNSGSNLFSVMNLGIGLEHKISKSISVRINPYLKIPLKGLGIGSIPITSSGVNVGITVPFHK